MPLNYELADFSQHDPRYLEYGHDWLTPKPTLGELKATELAKAAEEKRLALANKNKDAWAEGTGTAGDLAKQGAAAIYSGLASIGGGAIEAAGGLVPNFLKGTLEEQVPNAYEAEKQGIAQLQDIYARGKAATDPIEKELLWKQRLKLEQQVQQASKYLDSPMDSSEAPGIMANIHDITDPGITRRSLLDAYTKSADAYKGVVDYGKAVTQAGQSAVNRSYTEVAEGIAKEFGAEAGKAWDKGDYGTAIGTALLGVGKAVTTNPAAAYTLGLESLFQSLAAANPATAVAVYGPLLTNAVTKGKEDYAKEHDGKLPGEAETGIIEIASTLAVASDFVGDRLMVKLTPILRDAIKKNPTSIPPTLREQLVAKHPKFKEVFKEAGIVTGMLAGETAQGTFQNVMEQYASKQDASKIDTSEAAEAGIIEGTAAGLMGGVRALSSPGKVLSAGSKNNVTNQAVTAIEAFQKTPEYQSLGTTKEPAGAAYTAFASTVADTAIAPEAKQAAFNNALAAIVSNPDHPNIKIIAGRLKDTATKAGITIPESVNTLLTDIALVKPSKAATFYRDTRNAFLDKQLSEKNIEENPTAAVNRLKVSKFKSTNIKEYNVELEEIRSITNNLISSVGQQVKNGTISKEDGYKLNETIATISDGFLTHGQNLLKKNKAEVIQEVATAKVEDKDDIKLGSNIDGLISLLTAKEGKLTTEEIEQVLNSPVLTEHQRRVFTNFKNVNMEEVNTHLFQGGMNANKEEFKGFNEYLREIEKAKLTNDQVKLDESVKDLENWSNRYMTNRTNVIKAYEGLGVGKEVTVPNLSNGEFWLKQGVSKNFVNNLKKEVQAFALGLDQAYLIAGRENPSIEASQTTQNEITTATPSTTIPPASTASIEASNDIFKKYGWNKTEGKSEYTKGNLSIHKKKTDNKVHIGVVGTKNDVLDKLTFDTSAEALDATRFLEIEEGIIIEGKLYGFGEMDGIVANYLSEDSLNRAALVFNRAQAPSDYWNEFESLGLEITEDNTLVDTNTGEVIATRGPKQTPTITTSSVSFIEPSVDSFIKIFDTDTTYDKWSNTRDGSDRAVLQDQIQTVAKTYSGKVTPETKESTIKELTKQFKWFRNASPEERNAAVDSLMAVTTPSTAPTTPVATTPSVTQEEAPIPTKTESEDYRKAREFIEAINTGGIPLNPAKVNEIARGLGLEVSKSAKPEETIQRIRDALKRGEVATTPSTTPVASQEGTSQETTEPIVEEVVPSVSVKEVIDGINKKAEESLINFIKKNPTYKLKDLVSLINNLLGNFAPIMSKDSIIKNTTEFVNSLKNVIPEKQLDNFKDVLNELESSWNIKVNVFTRLAQSLRGNAKNLAIGAIKPFEDSFTINNNTIFAKSNKPIRDLLSKAKLDSRVASSLIKELEDLANKIKEGISNTQIKTLAQNPALHLTDNYLNILPGVAEAISIVAHTYVSSQGNSLLFNNMDTLRMMFGFDSRERLPNPVFDYTYSGKSLPTVADHIGRDAYQMLGIKTESEIARKRMIQALGIMGIIGLNSSGYTKQISVSLDDYLANFKTDPSGETSVDRDSEKEGDERNKLFVALESRDDAETGFKVANGKAEITINRYRENPDIRVALKDMFGVENRSINPIISPDDPRLKPSKYLTGTQQEVNSIGAEALEKLNSRAFVFNKTGYANFINLYNDSKRKDILLKEFGFTFDLENEPIFFRKALKAKNDLILKEIQSLIDYKAALDATGKEEFFIPHSLTKFGRVMLDGRSGINPRESKILRFLVNLTNFSWKLDPKDKDFPEHMFNFKHAVMGNFGNEVSKTTKGEVETGFDDLVAEIEELGLEETDANDILDLVVRKKTDHPTEAMNAIINVIRYIKAKGNSFDVVISLEVDGKTNGMAWAYLQSGGQLDPDLLTAMGLFTKPNQTEFVDEMAKDGMNDTYQSVAIVWGQFLDIVTAGWGKEASAYFAAQQAYLGSFFKPDTREVSKAGRELSKYPFMKMMFGQGINAMVADVGNKLLEGIYKEFGDIKKASIDGLTAPEQIHQRLEILNANVARLSNVEPSAINFTVTDMDYRLDLDLEERVIRSVTTTYGEALKSTIEHMFGGFMKYREAINTAMNILGDLFIQKLNLVKAAHIEKTDKTLTDQEIMDLIYDTEGELYKLLPAFLTPNASKIEEGLFAVKMFKQISPEDKVQVTVKSGSIQNYNLDGTPQKNKTSSVTGGIKQLTFREGGLMSFVGGTHSQDAAQAQRILREFESLGVHDAFYFSIPDLTKGSYRLNEMFGEMQKSYSMAKAVLDRFNEVYEIAGSGSKLAKLGIVGVGANRLKDRFIAFKRGVDGKAPLYSAIELAVNTTPDNVKKVLKIQQFPFLGSAAATVQVEDMVWDTDFTSTESTKTEETSPVVDSVAMFEQAEPIDSILADTAKYLKLEIESIDFMMTTKEEDVFIKEFFEKYSQADIAKAKQTLNCQGK
jgi:hypothetical protein